MIMKSVSFTIICEIGNVFQINERFFWHSSIQKGTNFCLENLIKGQRTRLSAKIPLIIFFSICNFIEANLGDAIADHYLQVKRFVHMPIEDMLCYMLSFLYHLSNNYHEYECLQHMDKFKHIKSILLSIFSNSSTSLELLNFEN